MWGIVLIRDQEAAGSNPAIPTKIVRTVKRYGRFLFGFVEPAASVARSAVQSNGRIAAGQRPAAGSNPAIPTRIVADFVSFTTAFSF